jgi:polyisoprenoid-binding protein YceI
MRSLVLVLALAATPAAAQADRVTLRSLHVLCSTEATANQLNELRGNVSAWRAQVQSETAQKNCTILPSATNVWVESRSGALTCAKGDDMPGCGWTVLDAS